MTRFFYSDPLAAGWQAKHHGMRFIAAGQECWMRQIADLLDSDEGDLEDFRVDIHPDSLPVLKVQLGDIASMTKAMDRYAAVNVEEMRDAFNEAGGYKIIQRRGILFHWPELEESEAA